MVTLTISEDIKNELQQFLDENPQAELVNTYLFFIQRKYNFQPVLYPKEKLVYQSAEDAIRTVEKGGKLWNETEIKIGFAKQSVNEQTKKIYICPFTGKVFGDNTHPNPQDAIYDWVSKCPENTERVGGLRVKRFFVSEDPEMIKSYISKTPRKEPITKVVFSSALSGKLFNSREAVIKDFRQNYLREMELVEVQNQNRFQIEEKFLEFIQNQLVEDKVSAFVEALAEHPEFSAHIERWLA